MTAEKLNELVETAMFYIDPVNNKYNWKDRVEEIVAVMPLDVLEISASRGLLVDRPTGVWDDDWVAACQKELENRIEKMILK